MFFAHEGHVRRRHHAEQTEQALCLTLITNAVVLSNTVYLQAALDALRLHGHDVDDEAAAHLSPAMHERINGSYTFDVDQELGRGGLRPLRELPQQRKSRRYSGEPVVGGWEGRAVPPGRGVPNLGRP